jgi:hypothetical protein
MTEGNQKFFVENFDAQHFIENLGSKFCQPVCNRLALSERAATTDLP